MRIQAVMLLFVTALIFVAEISYAGCDYKIIDFGDHVEAVCIGEPLTEAQRKELEKQQKEAQQSELLTQKSESNEKVNASSRGVTGQQNHVSSRSGTLVRLEPVETGNVVVESYDVKYIPSNKPTIRGRQFPGEYSVKVVAKNNGRQGSVTFKLKQTDFQGYETESIRFSDQFEKDQYKTVTTHVPATSVPFIQSDNWIMEVFKN